MLAKVLSGATIGLDSVIVEVEVDVASQGLPSITIVGLASKAVDEARQRVRSAIKNSAADYPSRRITVNLAPADLTKEGAIYDMPMAVGILLASQQIEADISRALFFGELSLDGSFRHSRGALPLTLLAKQTGLQEVFLPQANAAEVSIVSNVIIYPVDSLRQLILHLTQQQSITPIKPMEYQQMRRRRPVEIDFSDIKGQELAKRTLEIAAAGGHNVFMYGPPGGGKTMMARALAGILPSMTEAEAIDVTKIYSITGNIPAGEMIMTERPFRNPHHTTSKIGLIGGGSKPLPGEISLAHRGVLFLDEFPEFPRNVLESLRQPMEDMIVHISRAAGTMRYPANFILVAAANPCPCGYYGSAQRDCTCLPGHIHRYQKKISGPILDRIDLHIEVPEVNLLKLDQPTDSESSHIIRKRVEQARSLQRARYQSSQVLANADLGTKNLKSVCCLTQSANQLLLQAATKMGFSARSYNKIIKIARTIADLESSPQIEERHVGEAVQYRPKANHD